MNLRQQIEADRQFLVRHFPRCFAAKGFPKRPLAINIHIEMTRRGVLPDKRLRAFLGDYTRGPAYHEAVARGGHRYGLDGQPTGEVDEGARHRAVTLLGQMRAQNLDRAELKMLRTAIGRICLVAAKIHHGVMEEAAMANAEEIRLVATSAASWRQVNDPAGATGNGALSPEEESEALTARPAGGVTPAGAAQEMGL